MSAFKNLAVRGKLYCIIGILVLSLVSVVAVGVSGMWFLSSVRAYVGGESLWAKAQKNAIYSLSKYALFRDEADYRNFEEALKIPLGDRKARLELQKINPDLSIVEAGLLEGGNHPDDIPGVVILFRRFSRVPYIKTAIRLWSEGDETMSELETAAARMHRTIFSGRASPPGIRSYLKTIDAINDKLTAIETEFSYTLGEASRWAKRTLFWTMLLGSALLGAAGIYVSLLISGQIASGIRDVSDAAAKVAGGDLSVRLPAAGRDELGRLAEDFNRMTESLAKVDRMKNDFISTVSHELRTPLTLTLAPLESLLSDETIGDSREQKTLLETMHNNAVRLLQMVNGLLDFSKLEARKVEVHREPTDLAALTRSVIDDFKPIASHKSQTLVFKTPQDALYAEMDRYLYERILFNLISNALKFTPEGGTVIVRLDRHDDTLTAAVTDTGIGIAPEDQKTLFQKFRQLESSSTRRFEGTGLGLALVKEFCQLLGGEISLISERGKGSTFIATVQAPRCPAPKDPLALNREATRNLFQRFAPEADAASMVSPELKGQAKVLIAEDNLELARYIERLLSPLSSARIARDGSEALRLARTWGPDLIISDVMMPNKDGLALCREVKADPATAGIPVILLTALTERAAMVEGWKAGADEYLFKPFHPSEVVARVKYMLEALRARRKIENRLKTARDAAASLGREMESFSYSVAHDLRAPLRKIAGFSEILKSRLAGQLDAKNSEYLRKVQDGAIVMDRLIDGLLRLARITRQEPRMERLDLSGLAHGIAEELKRSALERKATFLIQPSLTALGDPDFTALALRNLLENSWKFTSKQPDAQIEFGLMEKDQRKIFFVRDNGVGFDPACSNKLFKAFERLHRPDEYPGTGVGLATVRRAIERQGGRIWAESAPGQGAAFYFTLKDA